MCILYDVFGSLGGRETMTQSGWLMQKQTFRGTTMVLTDGHEKSVYTYSVVNIHSLLVFIYSAWERKQKHFMVDFFERFCILVIGGIRHNSRGNRSADNFNDSIFLRVNPLTEKKTLKITISTMISYFTKSVEPSNCVTGRKHTFF